MNRWLVTGPTGMLGSDLTATLVSCGEGVIACARRDLNVTDVTDEAAVAAAVRDCRPDIVVSRCA